MKDVEKIKFISSNRAKTKVLTQCVTAVAPDIEIDRVDLPLIEPQASTLEAVAMDKARQAFAMIHEPLVVEDSGLCVDGLATFPGPCTKYILETIGVAGLLRLANGLPSRTCRFVGAMVYVDADGGAHTFIDSRAVGTLSLEIDTNRSADAWSALWNIFIPEGATKTISALSQAERDALWDRWQSHSVYAQFARWLSQQRAL